MAKENDAIYRRQSFFVMSVVSSDGSTEIHAASVALGNDSAQFLWLQVTALDAET